MQHIFHYFSIILRASSLSLMILFTLLQFSSVQEWLVSSAFYKGKCIISDFKGFFPFFGKYKNIEIRTVESDFIGTNVEWSINLWSSCINKKLDISSLKTDKILITENIKKTESHLIEAISTLWAAVSFVSVRDLAIHDLRKAKNPSFSITGSWNTSANFSEIIVQKESHAFMKMQVETAKKEDLSSLHVFFESIDFGTYALYAYDSPKKTEGLLEKNGTSILRFRSVVDDKSRTFSLLQNGSLIASGLLSRKKDELYEISGHIKDSFFTADVLWKKHIKALSNGKASSKIGHKNILNTSFHALLTKDLVKALISKTYISDGKSLLSAKTTIESHLSDLFFRSETKGAFLFNNELKTFALDSFLDPSETRLSFISELGEAFFSLNQKNQNEWLFHGMSEELGSTQIQGKGLCIKDGTIFGKEHVCSISKLHIDTNLFASTIPLKIKGLIDIDLTPISIDLTGTFANKNLTLSKVTITAPKTSLTLQGNYNFESSHCSGNGSCLSEDIKEIFPLEGGGKIWFSYAGEKSSYKAALKGEFKRLSYEDIRVKDLTIEGAYDSNTPLKTRLNLSGKNGLINTLTLRDFSATISPLKQGLQIDTFFNGNVHYKTLLGSVNFVYNPQKINVSNIKLLYGKDHISLKHPFFVNLTDSGWKTSAQISLDQGLITIKNIEKNQHVFKFEMSFDQISSDIFYNLTNGSYFLKGILTGNLSGLYEYDHVFPLTQLVFSFKNEGTACTTTLAGSLQNTSQLHTSLRFKNETLDLGVKGFIPLSNDLSLNTTAPAQLQLLAKGSFATLHEIFDFYYDQIRGEIEADVLLTGSLENQTLKGFINVKEGGYLRENIGLDLKNINLAFKAKGNKLVQESPVKLTDTEGNEAFIHNSHWKFGTTLLPYLTLSASFKNLHCINIPKSRRDGLSAFVSGIIDINGPVHQLNVKGKTNIVSFEKFLGQLEEQPIYKAHLFHLDSTGKKIVEIKEEDLLPLPEDVAFLNYDIDVSLDKPISISGQGLDSLWKGSLHIGGRSNQPKFKGIFNISSGKIRLFDKVFGIKKGNITFDPEKKYPIFYIESTNNTLPSLDVKIILEGGEDGHLQKQIVSSQNLSEAEIVQKMFFSKGNISFQSLNYLATNWLPSSLDFGFYHTENPFTKKENQYVKLTVPFAGIYGAVQLDTQQLIDSSQQVDDKLMLILGTKPSENVTGEVSFSDDGALGISCEWAHEF
jgi:hypothetical protein